jgi:hypothetical protein
MFVPKSDIGAIDPPWRRNGRPEELDLLAMRLRPFYPVTASQGHTHLPGHHPSRPKAISWKYA